MINRYCRDELINIALNQAQLPNLLVHDMPDGVVLPEAFSLQWLQDILDFWYHMRPFGCTVASINLPFSATIPAIPLPNDFILDVRNGYLVQTLTTNPLSFKRVIRIPYQKFLNRQLGSQNHINVQYPNFYCIAGRSGNQELLNITPTPTVSGNAILKYYQLPPVLEAGDKPLGINAYICTEYIKIRALEWAGLYEAGTANKFCEKLLAGAQAAGLLREPEDDEIPFDNLVYNKGSSYSNTYTWMGPV